MDVTKIGSHPGVRSDLFKRPLSQTRITDFFGGVSQVEIVPPVDSTSPILEPEEETVTTSDKLLQDLQPPQPRDNSSSSHEQPTIAFFDLWMVQSKSLRSWGSTLLLALIAGWVTFKQ